MIYFSFLPTVNENLKDYFNYSIAYLNSYKDIHSNMPSNENTLFEEVYAPHTFKSNSNKIVENIIISLDNNKLFQSNTLNLGYLINNMPLLSNLNKLKYQLAIYNFNLDRNKYLSGSLNFSRLIKKTISFNIGSDFKTYLEAHPPSTTNDIYSDFLTFKCYSCYFNNLIIKDGLAGLKYN